MKKTLQKLALTVFAIFFKTLVFAQTAGTLTFTFTEIPKTPTYNGTSQHALAAWIQTSGGGFVKTKLALATCCATCCCTYDHLPAWSANAGGVAGDCMNASVVDATTGATASAWKTYTLSWDGKTGAASTGTLQPDGIYKVTIQSTWSHAITGTAMTSYTFTKGANVDLQTPAANTTYSNVALKWQPASATGINGVASENPIINIYPNPTKGLFNVSFANTNSFKVINTLGVIVYEEKLDQTTSGIKNIDLTHFSNGVYFINVSNDKGSTNHKVILDK